METRPSAPRRSADRESVIRYVGFFPSLSFFLSHSVLGRGGSLPLSLSLFKLIHSGFSQYKKHAHQTRSSLRSLVFLFCPSTGRSIY